MVIRQFDSHVRPAAQPGVFFLLYLTKVVVWTGTNVHVYILRQLHDIFHLLVCRVYY